MTISQACFESAIGLWLVPTKGTSRPCRVQSVRWSCDGRPLVWVEIIKVNGSRGALTYNARQWVAKLRYLRLATEEEAAGLDAIAATWRTA